MQGEKGQLPRTGKKTIIYINIATLERELGLNRDNIEK